ncbi:MAG: transcriptional repressor [Coriobacteriia bacterium]|nr:transcriptional repressor [Coriobacteriia bacterium]
MAVATRNTRQKRIIEERLHALGNHPTADQLYVSLQADCPSIGKATVYRTLNMLVDQGRAAKVSTVYGADRFDHRTHSHCHVQCSVCGRVDDVDAPLAPGMIREAEAASGYSISGYSLVYTGVCPECGGTK